MANPYFAFMQFTVRHDRCGMKVGTDGVLLGAWTNIGNASRILDVGTGTGLIVLLLAQRSKALIDGVEIDENACAQANENILACPWKERICIHHESFQDFTGHTKMQYGLIVSNPPFFRNSLKPPAGARSLARHDESLTYEELLSCSSRILLPLGRLAVIVPAGDMDYITQLAYFHNLYPLRILQIRPSPQKVFSRCLMELSGFKDAKCEEKELIIKKVDLKTYTEEYVMLTGEFYL